MVKSSLAEEEVTTLHQRLTNLPAQGEMARCWEHNSPTVWVKAVQMLPSEAMKYSLNATLDTLPTNSNLQRWGKKSYNTCTLCKNTRQTLAHVLNNCPVAMDLRCYSRRHDQVLATFGDFIKKHLPPSFSCTIDLPTITYHLYIHTTSHPPPCDQTLSGGVTWKNNCGYLN